MFISLTVLQFLLFWAKNTFQDVPRFFYQQIVFPKEDDRVEAWVQQSKCASPSKCDQFVKNGFRALKQINGK